MTWLREIVGSGYAVWQTPTAENEKLVEAARKRACVRRACPGQFARRSGLDVRVADKFNLSVAQGTSEIDAVDFGAN